MSGVVSGSVFASAGYIFGPIALLVSDIIGYIIGSVIAHVIDQIVYSYKGKIPNFRYEITTFNIPWFWSGDSDINIIDLLMLIVVGIGGKMGYGSAPQGTTPLVYA